MPWLRKPRIVIDTNIFVSGVLFGGNPEKVLKLLADKLIELLISPEVAFEIIRKLEFFEVEKREIEDLKYIFDKNAVKVLTKDDVFLELSKDGKADYLITGDKDLLEMKQFEKTIILKQKDFLEILK